VPARSHPPCFPFRWSQPTPTNGAGPVPGSIRRAEMPTRSWSSQHSRAQKMGPVSIGRRLKPRLGRPPGAQRHQRRDQNSPWSQISFRNTSPYPPIFLHHNGFTTRVADFAPGTGARAAPNVSCGSHLNYSG